MNQHPNMAQFAIPAAKTIDPLQAERAIIGQCMINPERIRSVAGVLVDVDFSHEMNAAIVGVMVRVFEEGRTPSLETLVATLGDGEIESGLTVRDYLFGIADDAIRGLVLPIDDAIGVVLDWSRRNAATQMGNNFALAALSPGVSLKEALGDLMARADDLMSGMRSGVIQTYDMAAAGSQALTHMRGDTPGYPTTGLTDLDKIIGGWPRGELSILAGRPGMGKSAAAVSSLLRGAKAGHASVFFSLEMTGVQLGARLLTDLAYTNSNPIMYQDILNRNVIERDQHRLDEAQKLLKSLPVTIEQKQGITLAEIFSRSRKLAHQLDREGRRLETIFVDHMLLIKASNRYSGSRNNEVREYAEGLKELANELNVSVVGLCQLNRGVEGRDNKRPGLADLKESGALEEIASAIVFLFRPAYYLSKREDDPDAERMRQEALEAVRNTLEYEVAKNRNGRTGLVDAFADIGANAIRNKSFGR